MGDVMASLFGRCSWRSPRDLRFSCGTSGGCMWALNMPSAARRHWLRLRPARSETTGQPFLSTQAVGKHTSWNLHREPVWLDDV